VPRPGVVRCDSQPLLHDGRWCHDSGVCMGPSAGACSPPLPTTRRSRRRSAAEGACGRGSDRARRRGLQRGAGERPGNPANDRARNRPGRAGLCSQKRSRDGVRGSTFCLSMETQPFVASFAAAVPAGGLGHSRRTRGRLRLDVTRSIQKATAWRSRTCVGVLRKAPNPSSRQGEFGGSPGGTHVAVV
jgi:hypothetical protein